MFIPSEGEEGIEEEPEADNTTSYKEDKIPTEDEDANQKGRKAKNVSAKDAAFEKWDRRRSDPRLDGVCG